MYEPKWDGFRMIAFGGEQTRLDSRNGKDLLRYFPELRLALDRLPPGTIVDGEVLVVVDDVTEFDLLQLRIHPARSRIERLAEEYPARLVAFDLLAERGESLVETPYAARRTRLEGLCGGLGEPWHLTPVTGNFDTATRWFHEYEAAGCDGIICKRAEGLYRQDKREWIKWKHRRSIDCVIGGYRVHKDGAKVGSILLGLFNPAGELHFIGHCSGFSNKERATILHLLEQIRTDESFGGDDETRAPGAQSRWSTERSMQWTPVEPGVVVQVSYDQLQGGRFRHATRFERWRPDKPARGVHDGPVGEAHRRRLLRGGRLNPEGRTVLSLEIAEIRPETADAVTVTLDDPRRLVGGEAGQYVIVRVVIDGEEHRRVFSLSTTPELGHASSITVKRLPGGVVSTYFVERAAVGDVIGVEPAAGTFGVGIAPRNRRTYYAFAAGSGIVPVLSILRGALRVETRSVAHLAYGNRHPQDVIFAADLERLVAAHPTSLTLRHVFSGRGGRIDYRFVDRFLVTNPPRTADVWYLLCGPPGMNRTVEARLRTLGVMDDRLRVEHYVPPSRDGAPVPYDGALVRVGGPRTHRLGEGRGGAAHRPRQDGCAGALRVPVRSVRNVQGEAGLGQGGSGCPLRPHRGGTGFGPDPHLRGPAPYPRGGTAPTGLTRFPCPSASGPVRIGRPPPRAYDSGLTPSSP